MAVENYSQQDSRWADCLIGSTQVKMRTDGCLVTCLAAVAECWPSEVLLKIGFDGAQVNWKDLDKIGLELVEKVNSSDLNKINGYVSEYGFCIIRVDFDGSPKTSSDTHFVVCLPDGQILDPLDGFIKPMSTYPYITGVRAVKKIAITEVTNPEEEVKPSMIDEYSGLDLGNPEAMRIAAKAWKDLIDKKLLTKEEDEEKLNALSESFTKEIENIHLKNQNERIELSNQHEKDKNELKAQIKLLQDQLAASANNWKTRLSSRKFLMSFVGAVVIALVPVLDVFGIHMDLAKVEAALVGFITLIALFVVPEAYIDYKTREATFIR